MRLRPSLTLMVLATLLMGALVWGASAPAATPAGPRLAVDVGGPHPHRGVEVRTMGPAGEAQLSIVRGLSALAGLETPAWSSDGTRIALFAPHAGKPPVSLMHADGSHFHPLSTSKTPGGEENHFESEPVFAPDGDLVADVLRVIDSWAYGPATESEARAWGSSLSIDSSGVWSIPTDGSEPRALTPWRGFTVVPHGFTPDGELVGTVSGPRGLSVGIVNLHNDSIHEIVPPVREGNPDPAVSPDGTQVAYLRDQIRNEGSGSPVLESTDLMVVPIDGGTPRLLAEIPGGAFWPSWDPSGSRISFTTLNISSRAGSDGVPRPDNALMEVNADGSCLSEVYAAGLRRMVYGSAWQPGADRGAGPISC